MTNYTIQFKLNFLSFILFKRCRKHLAHQLGFYARGEINIRDITLAMLIRLYNVQIEFDGSN